MSQTSNVPSPKSSASQASVYPEEKEKTKEDPIEEKENV
jgi:hypothetical protein